MSSSAANSLPIAHAYRSLFRAGLRAVLYSNPARHTLKRILQTSFRNGQPSDFQPARVENTVRFLENAAKETGMEHKILKNLLWTRYWQIAYDTRREKCKAIMPWDGPIHKAAYRQFDITLDMLNESMQLCLR